MSEQKSNGHAAQANDQTPSFNLQRAYLKDLSLELPNAPQIFLEQESPKVEISIAVGGQRLADAIFESTVTATVTTHIGEKVLYLLVEATQAGIFEVSNIPADQLDPLMGIVCPSILYPYLRANMADAITRSSLPPLHLAEVNFQHMYEQRLAQLREEQAKAGDQQGSDAPGDSGIILPPGATRQ